METYNINEVSKACGLTPSMLRIWEERYGWPNPARKANGYRTYEAHHLESLRRIAQLLKNGIPIGQIIIDGMPRWPTQLVRQRAKKWEDWHLPRPAGAPACRLQADIVQALEQRRISAVKELMHRAMWTMPIHDEIQASLTPVMFGLMELAKDDRILPDHALLGQLVMERCLQRLHSFPGNPGTWAVPASSADHALAALVALTFCVHGDVVQPWLRSGSPTSGAVMLVGTRADPPDHGLEIVLRCASIRDLCAYEFTAQVS